MQNKEIFYEAGLFKWQTREQLAIDGRDLIAAGMQPGKELGQLLQKLLETVLECPQKNEKEILLAEAKNSNLLQSRQ